AGRTSRDRARASIAGRGRVRDDARIAFAGGAAEGRIAGRHAAPTADFRGRPAPARPRGPRSAASPVPGDPAASGGATRARAAACGAGRAVRVKLKRVEVVRAGGEEQGDRREQARSLAVAVQLGGVHQNLPRTSMLPGPAATVARGDDPDPARALP